MQTTIFYCSKIKEIKASEKQIKRKARSKIENLNYNQGTKVTTRRGAKDKQWNGDADYESR